MRTFNIDTLKGTFAAYYSFLHNYHSGYILFIMYYEITYYSGFLHLVVLMLFFFSPIPVKTHLLYVHHKVCNCVFNINLSSHWTMINILFYCTNIRYQITLFIIITTSTLHCQYRWFSSYLQKAYKFPLLRPLHYINIPAYVI